MTQYADADELLAMYTFDDKIMDECAQVPLPVIRESIKGCIVPDVEPVVRCKDCRHCETDYVHEGEYTCFYTGAMGLTLDDFCSKAEGKDEHDKSNNDN